jgi:hypothetical protein
VSQESVDATIEAAEVLDRLIAAQKGEMARMKPSDYVEGTNGTYQNSHLASNVTHIVPLLYNMISFTMTRFSGITVTMSPPQHYNTSIISSTPNS